MGEVKKNRFRGLDVIESLSHMTVERTEVTGNNELLNIQNLDLGRVKGSELSVFRSLQSILIILILFLPYPTRRSRLIGCSYIKDIYMFLEIY